jgi:hypothetical protein
MRVRTVLALAGASALAAVAAAAALAAGTASQAPIVYVRIEGAKKTLQEASAIEPTKGWVTKDGAPRGKCPNRSAQGALDQDTNHRWNGTWYSSYNEYLITSIRGEKPTGHDFWEIYVNNRSASKGACDLKLRFGEQLLFADTNGKEGASAIETLGKATAGGTFRVKLLGYPSKGTTKPKPLSGVRITGTSTVPPHSVQTERTNSDGVARFTAQKPEKVIVRAAPKGYIRTETVVAAGP